MSKKILSTLFLATFFIYAGCKSAPPAKPVAAEPVAAKPVVVAPVATHIADASYVPIPLRSVVDANGDSYVDANVAVNEWTLKGKPVYGISKDGVTSFYDAQGTELTGDDRSRYLAELHPSQ